MKTRFAFGKNGINVSIPGNHDCTILESKAIRPLPDVEKALADCLDAPHGCPPLSALAARKARVAIVVCDITRPAPNRVTLPPVLERLHRAGVRKDGIIILIATGLHRVATLDEVEQLVGREIAQDYRIISNDAKGSCQHKDLGVTNGGIPILIHREFVDADLRITLGLIEQHIMAGFSGGRKLVAPGVAAEKTIKAIHSPKFMRDIRACEGSIDDNPMHAELLDIARRAKHDFILDVTLTRSRQISGVFAGNPETAHKAGVQFLLESCLVQVDRPADLVVTSAAGYPLDLTFYQAIKAITSAQQVAKRGGRILVISECAEGVGSPEFAAALRDMQSFESFLDEIAHSAVKVDQWQLEKLALAGLRNEIFFFIPGTGQADLGFIGKKAHRNLNDAVIAATDGLPSGSRIYFIPEGPYTCARVVDQVL